MWFDVYDFLPEIREVIKINWRRELENIFKFSIDTDFGLHLCEVEKEVAREFLFNCLMAEKSLGVDRNSNKELKMTSECDKCEKEFEDDKLTEFKYFETRKTVFCCEDCCQKLEEDNWGGRVL